MKVFFACIASLFALIFPACVKSTAHLPAVSGFEPEKYLGLWYEIARMPHWFERDMHDVTAEYFAMADGTIGVINRGIRDGKGKEIRGIAKFVSGRTTGDLKVSFFGPFYGKYRILEITPDYSRAIVTGSNMNYLWILSRSPKLEAQEIDEIRDRLKNMGFRVENLEYPHGQR